MKRLIKKIARLPIIQDKYNWKDFDYINIGEQTVNVNDIVGLSDTRVDEYNDDWTPKDSEDSRWLYQKGLIDNGKQMEPVPLIKTPDGEYYPSGDGNHRISVAKVCGLQTLKANVTVMIPKDAGIEDAWEEYAKDKLQLLKDMEKEYKTMHKKFDKIHDEAYETGDTTKYEAYMKELNAYGDEMDELEREILEEEKEFKNNILKRYLESSNKNSRLKKIAYGEELNSKHWDNEVIYSIVNDQLNIIDSYLKELGNIAYELEDSEDYVIPNNLKIQYSKLITNVNSSADTIMDNIKDAKNNGIENENQLLEGNNLIEELEKTFNSLKDELYNISYNGEDLSYQINEIKDRIRDIENNFNNLQFDKQASIPRLKKISRRTYICDVHDSIKDNAEYIINECDKTFEHTDDFNEYIINDFITNVQYYSNEISNDINEAKDMNQRMGNGIDVKNSRISELNDEIHKIEEDIKDSNYSNDNLKDELNDLKETLTELENELSNYGG